MTAMSISGLVAHPAVADESVHKRAVGSASDMFIPEVLKEAFARLSITMLPHRLRRHMGPVLCRCWAVQGEVPTSRRGLEGSVTRIARDRRLPSGQSRGGLQ